MTLRVLEFETKYEGAGEDMKPVEWVKYTTINTMHSTATWERVSNLKPRGQLKNDNDGTKLAVMQARWEEIEPAYDAWKKGEELPVSGTPITAWAAMSKDVATAFKRAGITTVEDVAALSEATFAKIATPNVRSYVAQARTYLETVDVSVVAKRNDDLMEQNMALMEKVRALTELVEQNLPKKPKAKEPT